MLNIKPVILLTKLTDDAYHRRPIINNKCKGITQEMYNECLENKKYIQLGENKILSEEEYNNIKFYNNSNKGLGEYSHFNQRLYKIITDLILIPTATIDDL